jgi:poly-gamma-glutamate capsule biosynthesis protein CapA/YwtB (metallophosphatase superfamily)
MQRGLIAGSVALVLGASGVMLSDIPARRVGFVRPAAPPQAQEKRAEILFGGDLLFDRSIRLAMEREGEDYVLSCIADFLRSADLVVANLEGPITSSPSKSAFSKIGEPDNFTFTFPTSTASLLARHNIRLVNIGNNHIMNFGREGLFETLEWLDRAEVAYMGNPDAPEENRVARIGVGGVPFSFVNWSDWTSDKTDHTVLQVKKERDAGRLVVVYTHWGDEYVPPPPRVKELAHQFVEAGAEIVIGSHPHIVQERELYRGKYIYYSLGNMLFDQYWEDAVRRGLLLRVVFTPEGAEWLEEIPIENQTDRRTCAV